MTKNRKKKKTKTSRTLKKNHFNDRDTVIYLSGVEETLLQRKGLSDSAKCFWIYLLHHADEVTYRAAFFISDLADDFEMSYQKTITDISELFRNQWAVPIHLETSQGILTLQLGTPLDVQEKTHLPGVKYLLFGIAATIPEDATNDNAHVK